MSMTCIPAQHIDPGTSSKFENLNSRNQSSQTLVSCFEALAILHLKFCFIVFTNLKGIPRQPTEDQGLLPTGKKNARRPTDVVKILMAFRPSGHHQGQIW